MQSTLSDDEIAVVTQAESAVNAMFKRPLRVGLLVEPTVSPMLSPNLRIPCSQLPSPLYFVHRRDGNPLPVTTTFF